MSMVLISIAIIPRQKHGLKNHKCASTSIKMILVDPTHTRFRKHKPGSKVVPLFAFVV